MEADKTKSRAALTWKLEEPTTSESRDDDVGPAWVNASSPTSYPTGPVANGRWITRREARAIAEEHGLIFFEDDGGDQVAQDSRPLAATSASDIIEVNRRLRVAGVSESELRLEASGFGDVVLWGTMLQSLARLAHDPNSPFTTAMLSMSFEEALSAVDELVPEWRSNS